MCILKESKRTKGQNKGQNISKELFKVTLKTCTSVNDVFNNSRFQGLLDIHIKYNKTGEIDTDWFTKNVYLSFNQILPKVIKSVAESTTDRAIKLADPTKEFKDHERYFEGEQLPTCIFRTNH